MTDYYGPLINVRGADRDVVVDPRFGTGTEPTAPSGWDGGGEVGVYDPRFGESGTPVMPAAWTVDPGEEVVESPGEVWLDVDATGTTDVSAAINSALTTEAGYARPRTVRLRPGIFRLDTALGVYPRTRLMGSGMRHTVLQPTGTTTAIVRASGVVADLDDLHIADMEIDGTQQTFTGSHTPKAAFFTNGRRIVIRNLFIHDISATGLGIDSITGLIENVYAVNCGRQITSGAYPTATGSSGIGIGVGELNTEWEPLTIAHCHAEDNGNYGIFLELQVAGVTPAGITIMGCSSRGNGRGGIGECGAFGTRIIGNSVTGNAVGIELSNGTITQGRPGRHVAVQGNYVAGNAVGIQIDSPTNGRVHTGALVTDNHVRVNTSHGVLISGGYHNTVTVEGNHIEGNGGDGVATAGAVTRLAVAGNRVWDNTGRAIAVGGPTTAVRVTGNEGWNNAGGGVWFTTGSTHQVRVAVEAAWVQGVNTLPV